MKEPAQCSTDVIEELQSKIQILENENRLLRERLDEAGISYADIVLNNSDEHSDIYDPDQGARIKRFEIADKIASDFFMMFCHGRKDVYDLRYTNPKTGKNGYYTQCFNRWDRSCHIQKKDGVRCKDCELRAYKPVTLPLIKAHMNGADPNGNDVAAIYQMLENNLCQLLVFDFDNHAKGAEQEDHANVDDSWKEEINALHRICRNLDVDAVVERSRSGRGAHLDMPNYDESRFIYLGKDEGKYIVLPRGLREEILERFDKAGVRYDIEDNRSDGRKINVSFKGSLRESQVPAVEP